MANLAGKTALVTGASRGIGRSTAERLARDGARVGVHYGQHKAAARDVVLEIESAGGSAFAIQADLSLPHAAEALWAAYDQHADGVDILVNNAGEVVYGTISEVRKRTSTACSRSMSKRRPSSSSMGSAQDGAYFGGPAPSRPDAVRCKLAVTASSTL